MKESIALDLGPDQAKLICLNEAKGKVILKKVEISPLPSFNTDDERQHELPRLLKKLHQGSSLKTKRIYCLAPGGDTVLRLVDLPLISHSQMGQVLKYEIDQYIPGERRKTALGWQVFRAQDGYRLLLAISRTEAVEKRISLVKDAHLKLGAIGASPLALFNAFSYNYGPRKETMLLLNIGADQTDLVIVKDGLIQYARLIPLGGDNLDRSLSEEFKLGLKEAKSIKEKEGASFGQACASLKDAPKEVALPPGKDAVDRQPRIQRAIEAGLESLLFEIRNSLKHFSTVSEARMQIERIYLCGGTSLLPGIAGYFSRHLEKDAELLNPLKRIEVLDDKDLSLLAPSLAIGVGLALQGLNKAPLKINIIPEERREVREAKIKARYLALTSILVLTLILTPLIRLGARWGYYRSRLGYVNKGLSKYEDYLPQLAEIRDKSLETKRKTRLSKKLIQQNRLYPRYLKALSRLTPEDVYFTAFLPKLNPSEQIDYLILKGRAASYEEIEKLTGKLEASALFSGVKVAGVSDSLDKAKGALTRSKKGLEFILYLKPGTTK